MIKKDTRASMDILLIDDDKLSRSHINDILLSRGYKVWLASNGNEALNLLEDMCPDLILLNFILPGIDGLELCRIFSGMDRLVGVPIIIMSAKGDKELIEKALEYKADDFIVKPIEEFELLARLRSQLRVRRMYMELKEDRRNMGIILEILKKISATLDTYKILRTIVKNIAEITESSRASVVQVDKAKNLGYILVSYEDLKEKKLKIDLKKYPEIKKAIETRHIVMIEDLSTDPLMKEVEELVKDLKHVSVLVVPIVWEEKILGTLFLRIKRQDRPFTRKEINFCQLIARASFNALKNACIFRKVQEEREKLQVLAITDSLTNAFNHSYFYARLEEEYHRAKRYNLPLSCIMIDIDGFKRINDTYGHIIGDTVLRELALAVQNTIRKSDLFARYGGEEFAIILPHTDREGAFEEAERIRRMVAGLSFTELPGEESITISLGVATFPHNEISCHHDLIANADRGLYIAKYEGGNKTIFYPFK